MTNILLVIGAAAVWGLFGGFIWLYFTRLEKDRYADDNGNIKEKNILALVAISIILAAALFVFSTLVLELRYLKALTNSFLVEWLSVIAFIDLRKKIIPNKIILAGVVTWIISAIIELTLGDTSISALCLFSFAGAGITGGVLLLVSLLMKGAMGMGDVKLSAVLGLFLGVAASFSVVFLAVILLAIVAIILIALKKATLKSTLPMAPFLFIAFLILAITGI